MGMIIAGDYHQTELHFIALGFEMRVLEDWYNFNYRVELEGPRVRVKRPRVADNFLQISLHKKENFPKKKLPSFLLTITQ